MVPDKTCTSTLLECGAALAVKPGLATTSQPRLSQHNLSTDACPFEEICGGVEEDKIPEMPGTPDTGMMKDECAGMVVEDGETGLGMFRAKLGVFVTSTPTPSSGKRHNMTTSKNYQYIDNLSDVSACDPGNTHDGAVMLDRNDQSLPQPSQVRGEGDDEGDDDHVAPLSSEEKGGEVWRRSDAKVMTGGGQGGGVDDVSDTCTFSKGGICLLHQVKGKQRWKPIIKTIVDESGNERREKDGRLYWWECKGADVKGGKKQMKMTRFLKATPGDTLLSQRDTSQGVVGDSEQTQGCSTMAGIKYDVTGL